MIGGTVSGLREGVKVIIVAFSPDLGVKAIVEIIGNGEWGLGLTEEGKYLVRAEAPGYTSRPEFYEVQIAKGQDIFALNFVFS